MAFEEQSLDEITDALYSDIENNVCVGSPSLAPKKLMYAIAKAVGFALWSLQVFFLRLGKTPFDAKGRLLDAFAAQCGVTRNAPQYAGGVINITGSGELPVGSIIERCDGCLYETIQDAQAPGSVIVIAVNTGPEYNTPNGSILTINNSFGGVDPNAQVADSGIAGGSNLETDESYRERIIACFANPCRTGVKSDYEFWTRLYNGVTRICCVPKANGPGTVKVYFAMDETYANGVPSQEDVDNVQDILDENVPAGVCATACAINPEPIDIKIRLLDGYNAVINQGISDALVQRIRQFECGEFCVSDIIEIINQNYDGCFELCSPESDFQLSEGQLPIAGTITFIT